MAAVDNSDRGRPSLAAVIRVVVTVVLGGIGAAAGFKHTHDWATAHGQTGWLAWADAVVIEGIAVVAGFEIHRDHHQSRVPARRRVSLPVLVLVAGFTVQMAAQVALAEPTPAGWLLAAMPALGFLVVVKLLMRRTPVPASSAPPSAAPGAESSSAETGTVESSPAATAGAGSTSSAESPTGSRVRLAPAMTDAITRVVEEVRADGREPTTADIRRAVKVSDNLAAQILDDLPARNGHPVA